MSTIDPLETARRRQQKYRGTASALSVTVVWGVLSLVAASVVGLAVGGVFEQVRVVSINSVFGTWETGMPLELRSWGLPVGIIASIVCVGRYGTWNHRYSGRTSGYAIVGPLTIILAGLAIGTAVATTMWTEPDAVGVAVDPAFSHDEPWGAGEWILYAGRWWLPGLFALLAVLGLLARASSRASRRRADVRIERLLSTGALVEAEIVQAPLPAHDASRMAATLVARFADAEGTERWVRCLVLIAPADLPATGQTRPLVFDPSAPGDPARIFLSPAGGTGVEDFEPVQPAD